jgi:diguanylate cyclase (GGDEF)-like protein
MSRGFRVFLVGFVLAAIFYSFSYVYIKQRLDDLRDKKYQEISKEMHNELELLIQEKSEAILLVGLTLSQNRAISAVLSSKRPKKLQLDELTSLLERYTSLHNVRFQVLNSDGIPVYKSWNSNSSKNLIDNQSDIEKLIRIPKVRSTITITDYDLHFQTIVPLYDKYGRLIGFLETIAKFNSLVSKLKMKGYQTLLVVDKHYKKHLQDKNSNLFVGDYYIVNTVDKEILLNVVKEHGVDYFLKDQEYILDTEDNYLFSVVKIPDINQNPMAYFIIAKPLYSIDMEDIYNTRYNLIQSLVAIVVFVLLFLYIIYTINYKKFIQQQNKLLECSVEEKNEELERQSKEMKYLAHHDLLTALPNKNLFRDRLQQAIKHAKREHESIAILFLDLDRFKEINDTYGHDIGDTLLQQVAQRLFSCVRSEDTVARIGGDEFTVLLPNTNQVSVVKVIEKIFNEIKKPFSISNVELHTTFSVGISIYKQDGETPEILLRNADTAMYKVKDSGKNSYQFYNEEMTELVRKRLELDADIRNGLKNHEFIAYYQPKIDATTMKVVGLESLIRWNHPTRGLLFPVEFIPFAEEVGLIVEIDKYMLEMCVDQLVKWTNEGYNTGKLSINVSTKKLESDDFRTDLYKLVERSGVDPKRLELEILESQIMRDPERSIDILRSIRSLGISISIDDFGTGYSSLSYLKKLPVSKLKIDRSFIVDVPQDEDDVAIVRTIIALAKSLGLETIAEGVETKSQVEFLVQEGCHNIQGYYYSKPLPIEDCEEFMKKYR